jgi:hypothetical protein
MEKVYFPPTMTVVDFQQKSHILAGSINNVKTDVGLDYRGGGSEDAMSPGFFDDLEVF